MTPQEIDEMEAGPELDALVAEKVMGWYSRQETFEGTSFFGNPRSITLAFWYTKNGELLPLGATDFSTDIAAAWQVVEKLTVETTNFRLIRYAYNRVYACFSFTDWDEDITGEGNGEYSAPLAICKAALKVITQPALQNPPHQQG